MLLFLILSAMAVSLANGFSSRVMENQALLEPTGRMKLRWTVVSGTGDIEMEVLANCTGWMSVGFIKGRKGEPGALADVIVSGYDDETQSGYIQVYFSFISL
jgi:hypothetical protein